MRCGVQKFKNRFRLNTQIPIALIRSIRLVSVIQMNIDTMNYTIESNQERSIGLKNPHSRYQLPRLDYNIHEELRVNFVHKNGILNYWYKWCGNVNQIET